MFHEFIQLRNAAQNLTTPESRMQARIDGKEDLLRMRELLDLMEAHAPREA